MTPDAEPNRTWWRRLKAWWSSNHHRLMEIEDSPHAIALGVAIGMFFGFTPLWSVKTLLSIAVAWLFNSNKLAAALSVTLHDVLLPFMPAIYLWEYKLGYYLLKGAMPARLRIAHISMTDYLHWHVFVRVVWPTLVGSLLLALPAAIISYLLLRSVLIRRRKRLAAATV